MEFLTQQNQRIAGDRDRRRGRHPRDRASTWWCSAAATPAPTASAPRTGTGAKSVTSLELLEKPPERRDASTPWPQWPLMLRTSSSHEEGGTRDFAVLTKAFLGEKGSVNRIHAVRVRHLPPDATGRRGFEEIAGSDFEIPADLVLLAMGFVHPVHRGLIEDLGVNLDPRGNVAADPRGFATSEPGVFAAGDCRRGQSLVVWAIWEGREAARAVDTYLSGESRLQSRDAFV